MIDREIPKIRYIFILPIIATFVAALALLVIGFVETYRVLVEVISHPDGHALETTRLHFVEVIDVFLLATIMYVISGGFWQLFLGRSSKFAPTRLTYCHSFPSPMCDNCCGRPCPCRN